MTQQQLQQNPIQLQFQRNLRWTQMQQPVSCDSTLRGANRRVASGICLIVSGVAEIAITCYLLTDHLGYACQYPDRGIWGILCGAASLFYV